MNKGIRFAMGGGILSILFIFYPFLELKAVELSKLCKNNQNDCTIATPQSEVTNHGTFTSSNLIKINTRIDKFINYGTISNGIYITSTSYALGTITNYGEMHGVWAYQEQNITINNLGIMKTAVGSYQNYQNNKSAHFMFENGDARLTIENFIIPISESQSEFNNFETYNDRTNNKNSHLIVWEHGNTLKFVAFKDKYSKLILDFGSDFEFGKAYKIDKLVTNQNGNPSANLNIDFSRLTTRSELFRLTQSGNNFIVNLVDSKTAGYSTIGSLYKSNIRTMNNFYTISNSMIYPHKYSAKRNTNKRRVIRRVKKVANVFNDSSLMDSTITRHSELSLESEESTNLNQILDSNGLDSSLRALHYAQNDGLFANPLESHATFFYDSQMYLADTQRQTRTIRTRNLNTTNPNTNQSTNSTTNRVIRTTHTTQSNDNYYFILTPFVNHNLFFESGRYNLSGFDYGFLTAFSGKLSPSNALGTHFMMSYGSLGDNDTNKSKGDKEFNIKSLNLNIGLNYKLDLIFDSYIKARGDFYYFLNQVKTLTIFEVIKPNNFGFGLSVSYGKDFNFGNGGVLGVEGGIDYKALQSNTISLQNNATKTISETYQKALYNLIYVDLGMSYNKYFGNFGLNATLGIKGNITANKLATSKIYISTFNKSVDMVLDNDNFLGYANLGVSYVLNHKDFDMEFSLVYYGNYGDRVISNGGGVEWRVVW